MAFNYVSPRIRMQAFRIFITPLIFLYPLNFSETLDAGAKFY